MVVRRIDVTLEKCVERTADRIHLGERTDAHETNTATEEREDDREPFPFRAHSLLDVVERSTKYMSGKFVMLAVLDRKEAF